MELLYVSIYNLFYLFSLFSCPEHGGRECVGFSCYYFPSTQFTYNKITADDFCAQMGGHVLATETQQEIDYIKQTVQLSGEGMRKLALL